MKLILCVGLLFCACSAPCQTPTTLSDFPAPTRILQDKKQFDGLKLGPNNTFSIQQPPPDFQLDSFDFSPDGEWTFMRWGSGRVEVRNNNSGDRTAEFKFMPGVVFEDYHDATDQLVVRWQQGMIRLEDPHSGKHIREIPFEVGKFRYALQKVILAKDKSWIAYLNEENGKVLDLRTESPKVLADLEDAEDLALTADGSELWLVSRKKIFGLRTDSWTRVAAAPLLDSVHPTLTPTLALASSEVGAVAFIPSQTGLLRYELKSMAGRKVTTVPTYWVASDTAKNKVLVNEKQAFSLYEADGSLRCQWKQFQHQTIKVSENGKWLGSLFFGKVQLWAFDSLVESCAPQKP